MMSAHAVVRSAQESTRTETAYQSHLPRSLSRRLDTWPAALEAGALVFHGLRSPGPTATLYALPYLLSATSDIELLLKHRHVQVFGLWPCCNVLMSPGVVSYE